MFRYKFAILRENKMPVFKNQLPLRSCYLKVLQFVAASLLTLNIKVTAVHMFKTYG
jgi:hypothetical protein